MINLAELIFDSLNYSLCFYVKLSNLEQIQCHLNQSSKDGMAIVREYGKPDLFITMTCNPKWPEIVNELRPGQEPQDRPDIVARVFKDKMDQLMNDLVQGGCFGKVVGYLYCVEFQKRGLPHVHILLILAGYGPLTPELVDEGVQYSQDSKVLVKKCQK